MQISTPDLIRSGGKTRLEARVILENPKPEIPGKLFFELPSTDAGFFYPGMESFLAGLLPLAMHLGEDIHIDSRISPRFAFHLPRVQMIYNTWNPDIYQVIQINHKGSLPPKEFPNPTYPTLSFTGGADSLFSLRKLTGDNQPIREYGVKYVVFAKFGFSHHPQGNYEFSQNRFEKALDALGVGLLPLHTNLRHFHRRALKNGEQGWISNAHRAGMVAMGLALSGGVSKFYLSRGFPHWVRRNSRLDILLEQLLSTEWFEMIKMGIEQSRAQKLEALSQWPPAYELLDVCWWNTHGEMNCGRCPKCVRTMAALEAVGSLEKFKTFPALKPIDQIKWQGRIGELGFTEETLRMAIKHRHLSQILLTGLGVIQGKTARLFRNLARLLVPNFKK